MDGVGRPGARQEGAAKAGYEAEAPPRAPCGRSRYVLCELPAKLAVVRPPLDKPNPKLGIGALPSSGSSGAACML